MLVVDDESSIRELLQKTLALAEYDVDMAPDGRAALERLRLGNYDLLIADLKMPGMDGLTLIREAKRLKTDLPVIIITGFSTESSAIEAVNLGVAGYLTKPFRVPQVLAAAGEGARRSSCLLQLQDVTKAFGEKTLLEHVTWQVGDRDRVGLCGPNGAGKTTLLKMLAGLDEPDSGFIQKPNALTLGYLPQDGLAHSGRTVVAEASLALKPLLDLKDEMHALEERLGDPSLGEAEHEAILARYSEVQDRFRLGDGYQIELKVATVLRGLGFEPEVQEQLTDHLSGGWQMRLALAKLLLSAPDLLLLDEPTNHLDLEARNWLEEYLVAYPHAVILVSHDRYFLDAVVTHIADLTLRTITEYHTNYTKYLERARRRGSSGCATRSGAKTRRSSASRSSSTASATRPPRPRRCRAASRCSTRSSGSRCRPSASAFTSSFPRRRRAAAWCSS